MLRRPKTRTCAFCNEDQPLTDFINLTYAQCLTCWLEQGGEERVKAFGRAIFRHRKRHPRELGALK